MRDITVVGLVAIVLLGCILIFLMKDKNQQPAQAPQPPQAPAQAPQKPQRPQVIVVPQVPKQPDVIVVPQPKPQFQFYYDWHRHYYPHHHCPPHRPGLSINIR